jgi:pimeloyl-ACP methyl ester carboxylesterase
MPSTHHVTCRALGFAIAMAVTPHALANAPSIDWDTCPASANVGDWPELGNRLQCAVVDMPIDHNAPSLGTVPIDVVRVKAIDPTQRKGSIFYNIGGPGADPSVSLAILAAEWTTADPHDSVASERRLLADRYDLVAVVPRGMGHSWRHDCFKGQRITAAFYPSDGSDANCKRLVDDAHRIATACTGKKNVHSINTVQHVNDMDFVRRAIGDERIHFIGVSYGGLVGAWYAAAYPAHMDRMLLDSPIYFPDFYQTAIRLSMEAERRRFQREALNPLTSRPASYGWSDDSDTMTLLQRMPAVLRESWHNHLSSPWHLSAALFMQQWVEKDGWRGWDDLQHKAIQATFATQPGMSSRLRSAALELVTPFVSGQPSQGHLADPGAMFSDIYGSVGESVYMATLCNDNPWWGSLAQIRARADEHAYSFWTADGVDASIRLICHFWGGHSADRPSLDAVASGADFLILQSDGDMQTPLPGAEAILAKYPTAHLVVAEGSDVHGLLHASRTSCVEKAALSFLLDGHVPDSETRRTSCAFIPSA